MRLVSICFGFEAAIKHFNQLQENKYGIKN